VKKKKLTYRDVNELADVVFDKLKEDSFIPDIILCVGRGAMVPARILSDRLELHEIAFVNAKMYTGVGERNAKPIIGTIPHSVFNKKVLVVDDIYDTGLTTIAVMDQLRGRKPVDAKVATFLCKEHAEVRPAYYGAECKEDEWIVFPWETKEFGDEKHNDV
jgi:hypoxanthine phosphoribosyltransferase